ncbi:MAG: leucine-rich repeat protein [Lachnospiraceae bacterium]|nr:leucine-rich repeat protein [Lachnospiraceae bacterium]
MKKTIAKIMAAAMVLSAVPAVALPTMTAEAANTTVESTYNSTTVTQSTVNDLVAASTYNPIASDGYTGIVLVNGDSAAITATGTSANTYAQLKVSSSGELLVTADTSTKDKIKDLIKDIKDGKNNVTIAVTINGATTNYGFQLGGDYVDGKQYEAGITPEEGKLADGDVYATIDSTSELEVNIERGSKDGILDDNDDLRGNMLNLNTVTVGGVEFDVVKLGAQSLKKAHMKKIKAENVKKIGKGALRKAKQLKHADFQDSNKTRKILGKAFYDCKNLKTIIIDGRKLKTVGKDAFSGVKKNCTVKIKAKKSKFEADKKMILKNGGNKNLKFVRK